MAFTGKFRQWLVSGEVRCLEPDQITTLETGVITSPSIVCLFQDLLRLFYGTLTFRLYLVDPFNSFVRSVGLGCHWDICECGMVAKVCEEWCGVNQWVVVVVVHKLSHRQ